MLSQHEADMLAEALTTLGRLRDVARREHRGDVTPYRAFGLGAFTSTCHLAAQAVREVLSDAAAYLDDEKAADVLLRAE